AHRFVGAGIDLDHRAAPSGRDIGALPVRGDVHFPGTNHPAGELDGLDHRVRAGVDDGHRAVVLAGDIGAFAVRREGRLARAPAHLELVDDLVALGVAHRDVVVLLGGDVHEASVRADADAFGLAADGQ